MSSRAPISLEPGRRPAVVRGDRQLEQSDRGQDDHDSEGDQPVVASSVPVPTDQESDREQHGVGTQRVGQREGEHRALSIIPQMPDSQPQSVAQVREGLDQAKALYEWNYRKQLLRIQAEASGEAEATEGAWERTRADIFGEEFLFTRPLLEAISADDPVVLLIDEIDKTDQEFEAMLLEVLSDFQISIPELGVIEARTRPIVVLTSNNSRELTEALKRRCLYLWLDYPSIDRELEIVRLHAPDLDEGLARRLVEIVHMVRQLDLKKPPSIAESIDWARTLLLIGADDIDRETFESSMSILVKHRSDFDLVAERVAVTLQEPAGGVAGGP